jgi:hypothetical protein
MMERPNRKNIERLSSVMLNEISGVVDLNNSTVILHSPDSRCTSDEAAPARAASMQTMFEVILPALCFLIRRRENNADRRYNDRDAIKRLSELNTRIKPTSFHYWAYTTERINANLKAAQNIMVIYETEVNSGRYVKMPAA